MYYGHYDETGKYIGFFPLELADNYEYIPVPNIKLTDEQWKEALTGDYKVVKGKHIYSPPPEPSIEEIVSLKLSYLDNEYDPQFEALTLAWATASMDGKTEIADARMADKQALQKQYEIERSAILNG